MRDSHAWKYENTPPPKPQNSRQIRAQAFAEVREIITAEIVDCCGHNSSGAEDAKARLRKVMRRIGWLA